MENVKLEVRSSEKWGQKKKRKANLLLLFQLTGKNISLYSAEAGEKSKLAK